MSDIDEHVRALAEARLAGLVLQLEATGMRFNDQMITALLAAIADGLATGFRVSGKLEIQRSAALRTTLLTPGKN